VADYATLMESLFDFDAIRAAVKDGLSMTFDAMHAVTGPYAHEILEKRLGFRRHGAQRHAAGGFRRPSPDPNMVHAKVLFDTMFGPDAPISARPAMAMATAT
jgi:phosphoglucomutase